VWHRDAVFVSSSGVLTIEFIFASHSWDQIPGKIPRSARIDISATLGYGN
jgi:hypothetical protein